MLTLNNVLLTSEDHKALIEFYTKILGKQPDWTGGEHQMWKLGSGFLVVGPHSDIHGKNDAPGRIMFGFETEDVASEYKRMVEAGAREVQEPYHPGEYEEMWLATLADPDGNYFQLGSPMKM